MRTFTTLRALAVGVVGATLIGCAATSTSDESVTGEVATNGITRDFVAVTLDGDEISGASMRGHVTIVDFWAVF